MSLSNPTFPNFHIDPTLSSNFPSAALGFEIYWLGGDTVPGVRSLDEKLEQAMFDEYANHPGAASGLTCHVRHLSNGLALPMFWTILKTCKVLKKDLLIHWQLGKSTEHLLASYIMSKQIPRLFLASKPEMWDICPSLVQGGEVWTRITLLPDSLLYRFDLGAQRTRWYLIKWTIDDEIGSCLLVMQAQCVKVVFNVLDLLIQPIVMVYPQA